MRRHRPGPIIRTSGSPLAAIVEVRPKRRQVRLGGAAWTAGGAAAPTAGAASSARSASEGARPATRAKAASPAANLPAILKAIASSIAVRGPKAYKAELVRGPASPPPQGQVIGSNGVNSVYHPLNDVFWPLLRRGHGRLKTCQTGDEPDMKAQSLPGSEIRRPQRAVAFAVLGIAVSGALRRPGDVRDRAR